MTRPKNGLIWFNISGYTGPIFAVLTPYESALLADDGSVAFFKFVKRRCQNEGKLILRAFSARSAPKFYTI